MSEQPSSETPLMVARGVSKSFASGNGRIDVLRGVDLDVHAGRTISICGESGCGKSTLLNLLAGIEAPDEGTIHWHGKPIHDLPQARLPRMRAQFLGFIFQAFYLIPELDVMDNVLIAARIARREPMTTSRNRARELLGELGLDGRLRSLPEQLSGGERQRVAIARALINEPKVVLADEPTGNLDEKTSDRVIDQLLTIVNTRATALVMVTHNAAYAARADRCWHMHDGLLAD